MPTFVRSVAALGLFAAMSLLASGCSSKPGVPTLYVFNWSEYLDKEVLKEFEKTYKCEVKVDNYTSDTELEQRLQTGARYDVVFPSDRSMGPLLRRKGLLALDKDKLPNLKHVDPQFLDLPFDRGNTFSVPYFWGTVAVGIRTDLVQEPVKGFEILFDERQRGRITMLDDAEHVVAVALLHLGLPMNSTADEHLARAKELLLRQKPLVLAYDSASFRVKLVKGEAAVALGWSGDLMQAAQEEPKIQVVVPATGTLLWTDSMAIPQGARSVDLAHAFVNFLLDPDVAARNANTVRYPSPNLTARTQIDAELLADPRVYLPKELLDRCDRLQDRGPALDKIQKLWRELRQ